MDLTQKKWSKLGDTFWIKFILTYREKYYLDHPGVLPIDVDSQFVTFLRLLLDPCASHLHVYLEEVSVSLRVPCECGPTPSHLEGAMTLLQTHMSHVSLAVLNFHMTAHSIRCRRMCKRMFGGNYQLVALCVSQMCNNFELHFRLAHAIVSEILAMEVQDAIKMVNSNFKFPASWKSPVAQSDPAPPLECFLRMKFGPKLATQHLGCKMKDLGWWEAAPLPMLHPAATFIKRVPTSSWLSTLADVDVVSPCSGPRVHRAIAPWLDCRWQRETLWEVLDLMMPPVLAKRYFVLGLEDLQGEAADTPNTLSVGPWLALWLHTFDLEFMSLVQGAVGGAKFDGGRLVECRQVLDAVINKAAFPRPVGDCAVNSSEFLLCRWVILQLPWSAALLQQWLAVALLEITR
jgi:hypothetical protein